jgi:protein-S-isoprenylcysteine O-methyltransferase Ste14
MAYWMGWILTALIAAVIFRVFVRRDYLHRGKLGPGAVFLEFVIFGLHANLPYLYLDVPWPAMPPAPENPVQLYLGLAVSILGLVATLAIMAHLGFGTTVGQEPGAVRQTGPYRLSRNPQIITYSLMLIGLGVLYPSIETAAWILLFAAIAYLMVITEEEHLQNLFGESYQEYCKIVPRFIINWRSVKSRRQ